MALTLPSFVAVSAMVLAALNHAPMPVAGVTHAPPPWSSRVARSLAAAAARQAESRQGRSIQDGGQQQQQEQQRLALLSQQQTPEQLQQQLLQLQQLTRAHLQNWAQVMLRRLPLQQQPPQPQVAGQQQDRRGPAPAAGAPLPVADGKQLPEPARGEAPRGDEVQTTARPVEVANSANEVDSGPSKCVWAIVTCCQPQTAAVRYSCFELLGCPGVFWDSSPCEPDVASAALIRASKFYGRNASTPPP